MVSKKKPSNKKPQEHGKKKKASEKVVSVVKDTATKAKKRSDGLKARRPHRSFRLTRKRDYKRPLDIPGYVALTKQTFGMLFKNKKLFFGLVAVMVLLIIILTGLMSEEVYQSLATSLDETSKSILDGDLGQISRAGLLLLSTATSGGLNQSPSESQQIFSVLIFILAWMITVWLLRHRMSGNKVKLRDGLYNATAPLISTALVVVVIIVQLIPLLIAFIGYSAAVQTDFLSNPFYSFIFWVVALALTILSLYLISSTIMALVVVTIPGMYPMEAVKISGDLVIGRRLKVILRILWGLLMIVLMWIVVMIPIIMIDSWIKSSFEMLSEVPIVPFALLIITSWTVVFFSSYIYLFYRKLVDDNSKPA